eukprot:g81258.t1
MLHTKKHSSGEQRNSRSKMLGCNCVINFIKETKVDTYRWTKITDMHTNHPRYSGSKIGKLSDEDKERLIHQAQKYSWKIDTLRKYAEEKAGGFLPRKELQYMLVKANVIKS